jgi:hypothetical protein
MYFYRVTKNSYPDFVETCCTNSTYEMFTETLALIVVFGTGCRVCLKFLHAHAVMLPKNGPRPLPSTSY